MPMRQANGEIVGERAAHRGSDEREVGLRHAQDAEPKRRAPVGFAADERELLDQRAHRRGCAGK